MFNVLRPGSRLLDRLPLSRKFGLISLLVFVPALLTNYLLLDERLRYSAAIRHEISGLEPSRVLNCSVHWKRCMTLTRHNGRRRSVQEQQVWSRCARKLWSNSKRCMPIGTNRVSS